MKPIKGHINGREVPTTHQGWIICPEILISCLEILESCLKILVIILEILVKYYLI